MFSDLRWSIELHSRLPFTNIKYLVVMVYHTEYKVGLVLKINDCGGKSGKSFKACQVNLGDESNPITVVTSAANVREGNRVAIAPVGSKVLTDEGEEMVVKKTAVGGVTSEGMFCDSRMLGWSGGAVGVAVQIDDSFAIGSSPPPTKPRPKIADEEELPKVEVQGLFEKKLTKEEKKALSDERRKARKAAKEAN